MLDIGDTLIDKRNRERRDFRRTQSRATLTHGFPQYSTPRVPSAPSVSQPSGGLARILRLTRNSLLAKMGVPSTHGGPVATSTLTLNYCTNTAHGSLPNTRRRGANKRGITVEHWFGNVKRDSHRACEAMP
jgi:hypothetical protein